MTAHELDVLREAKIGVLTRGIDLLHRRPDRVNAECVS